MTTASFAERTAQARLSIRRANSGYKRFIVPAMFTLLILTIIPLMGTVGLSLSSLSYTSSRPTAFVGLDNYIALFSDPRFIASLWQSTILIFVPLIFQLLFGLLLALTMNERLPAMGWLRIIFIIPMFFPPIVMGLMWKILFTPQLGGVNYYIGLLGFPQIPWLSEPSYALASVCIAAIWGWTPFVAVMFYTAMQTFPKDLYEAARIDGASWLQQLGFVTLPLLRQTALVVVFRIMEALAIFPIIFVMTSGGPAGSTETANYYAYTAGFQFLKVGYASAIILMFLALLMIVLGPATRLLLRDVGHSGVRT
ncbi:MAG: carbohydrate ABC transporter permease [Hyphomicrobiaceae bacterium]